MGRSVGEAVARRLGKSLLELGGNNGIIVTEDADLGLVSLLDFFGDEVEGPVDEPLACTIE